MEFDGADSAVWQVDARGRPEGLTTEEIKEKEAALARRLNLKGEITVDPHDGELVQFRGPTVDEADLGPWPASDPGRSRACRQIERWADRLGIDKTRRLTELSFYGSPAGSDFLHASIRGASAHYELGYRGFPVFDGPGTADISVDLRDGMLTCFSLTPEDWAFETAKPRLTARRALDLAMPYAAAQGFGKPVSDNPSKHATPGYVRVHRTYLDWNRPPRRQARRRLAWRTQFQNGWVDIDAADGRVLGGDRGRPRRDQP
jgi:hypothetical protein